MSRECSFLYTYKYHLTDVSCEKIEYLEECQSTEGNWILPDSIKDCGGGL